MCISSNITTKTVPESQWLLIFSRKLTLRYFMVLQLFTQLQRSQYKLLLVRILTPSTFKKRFLILTRN